MSTYVPPTPNIVTALQGTYYGLAYLGLATLAYASSSDGKDIPAAIAALVQDPTRLPPIPDPTSQTNPPALLTGYWKLDWGPAVGDNSNTIFIVSFRQGTRPTGGGTDGSPYFFAVVNRGTDISAWWLAVEQQLVQDLGSFSQTPWAQVLALLPNPGKLKIPTGLTGQIANGTRDALVKVTSFTADWNGEPTQLAAAMGALLAEYPGTPTVVTGHSLGACITQVVAAYLAWQLYNTQSAAVDILPNPFAPPTPGDPAFAAMYDTLFPYGNFYFNTLDLVPCAWANISTVPTLWGTFDWPAPPANNPGPACPGWLVDVEKHWEKDVPPYQRPTTGVWSLTGAMPTQATMQTFLTDMGKPNASPTSWVSQLMWQHFPPCYYGQISKQMAGQVAPYPYVSTQAPY